MPTASLVLSHMAGRDQRQLNVTGQDAADLCRDYEQLRSLGIDITPNKLAAMVAGLGFGMDDATGLTFAAGIPVPVQFLQTFLPGFVRLMTTARKIDELIGVTVAGKWEDEEVVQGILELTGKAQLYGDYANIPFSSWNPGYERRSVIRFEEGLRVGVLEEARAAAGNINSAAEKRLAAALALDIARNRVGFFGFNGGANRTYGFLNDPSLPAYVTVPVGASAGTTWPTKTFLEITADVRGALAALRTQSGDTIDPDTTSITMAVSTNKVDFLGVTSTYSVSVRQWMRDTYPKVRVVSAPELNGANGGADVFYLYADSVADSGTDSGSTWLQLVPAKFRTIGVEKNAKNYIEDYSNATAGVMIKRPYAIVRRTGI